MDFVCQCYKKLVAHHCPRLESRKTASPPPDPFPNFYLSISTSMSALFSQGKYPVAAISIEHRSNERTKWPSLNFLKASETRRPSRIKRKVKQALECSYGLLFSPPPWYWKEIVPGREKGNFLFPLSEIASLIGASQKNPIDRWGERNGPGASKSLLLKMLPKLRCRRLAVTELNWFEANRCPFRQENSQQHPELYLLVRRLPS